MADTPTSLEESEYEEDRTFRGETTVAEGEPPPQEAQLPPPEESTPATEENVPAPEENVPAPEESIPVGGEIIPPPEEIIPTPEEALLGEESSPTREEVQPIPEEAFLLAEEPTIKDAEGAEEEELEKIMKRVSMAPEPLAEDEEELLRDILQRGEQEDFTEEQEKPSKSRRETAVRIAKEHVEVTFHEMFGEDGKPIIKRETRPTLGKPSGSEINQQTLQMMLPYDLEMYGEGQGGIPPEYYFRGFEGPSEIIGEGGSISYPPEAYTHELLEASEVDFTEIPGEGYEKEYKTKFPEEYPGEYGEGYAKPEEKKSIEGFLKGVEFGPRFHPFKMYWVFGITTAVNIINLSDSKRKVVVFTSAQGIILFDIVDNTMTTLEGHQTTVSSLDVNSTGQYLVSSDKGGVGEDASIIIWDTLMGCAIHTIYNPYPVKEVSKPPTTESSESIDLDTPVTYGGATEEKVEEKKEPLGTEKLALSPNAKYLIAVSHSLPIVNFWLWTYGRDQADDSYPIDPPNFGECTGISFHPNCQEQIMISFEKAVFFVQWDPEISKFVNWNKPEIRLRKKYGKIIDCTFVLNCHNCVAAAEKGALHFFGNTTYYTPWEEMEIDPNRFFVKTIIITKTANLNFVQSIDGLVVIGDSAGRVMFFDHTIRILYWLQDIGAGIASISFNVEPRKYEFHDPTKLPDDMFVLESPTEILEGEAEDLSDQIEILYKTLVPTDASLQKNPFVLRDFVILTVDASILMVDIVKKISETVYTSTKSVITAMECHTDCPYLVVAYESGQICLINYDSLEEITCRKLPVAYHEEALVTVSYLKYSPGSYRLACGRSNGELWFLEPILQEKKTEMPFTISHHNVLKICFSTDSNYCAYYDSNMTVILFRYSHVHEDWRINGKYRSHCKPITDIMFSPYVLPKFFTIGEDRHIVEYNAKKSTEDEIFIVRRETIEQSALPLAFAFMPHTDENLPVQLVYCDNQFKYKVILESNFHQRGTFLGPAYGCYSECPVNRIIRVPGHDNRYIIFATDRHIGIQSLPFTGNPYQYIGMFGHSGKLVGVNLSYDCKYIFTSSEDSASVIMWKCNYSSVDYLTQVGGTNLEPFYCLIEGGATGWLFREMQDLFYYMQILYQDENSLNARVVSDEIPIVELPDLMRACGFYPTEFEIRTLLNDIRHKGYIEDNRNMRQNCTFFEFVQLYINHRPVHGISMENLYEIFNQFCDHAGGSYGSVDKEEFLDVLCNKGEPFNMQQIYKCLAVLMREEVGAQEESELNFDFFPDTVGFNDLVEDLLGITTEDDEVTVGPTSCHSTGFTIH